MLRPSGRNICMVRAWYSWQRYKNIYFFRNIYFFSSCTFLNTLLLTNYFMLRTTNYSMLRAWYSRQGCPVPRVYPPGSPRPSPPESGRVCRPRDRHCIAGTWNSWSGRSRRGGPARSLGVDENGVDTKNKIINRVKIKCFW